MPTQNQRIVRRTILALWLGCVFLAAISLQEDWSGALRYSIYASGFALGLIGCFLYSKDPNKTPVLGIEEYQWMGIATFVIFGGMVIPKNALTNTVGNVLFYGLIAAFLAVVVYALVVRKNNNRS
jgi:cytochrome b561